MALGSDAAASQAVSGDAPPDAPGASAQAPEEAVETQLRAILEVTQTSAGAVCLFDQHQELLRLAVEVGLSDEGCRRLRNVRRGAATTWDMPLHSLLNRRAYLIESASKNRYVPPLVDNVAGVRAVACIPLYDGPTPVGSLILIALAPKTFGERQVRLLEQPVRDLVAAIIAMRKRVSHAAPQASARPSLSSTGTKPALANVTTAGPITPGIKSTPGDAGAPAVQVAIERARAELERLRVRVAEAEETAATERKRAAALEQQCREHEVRAGDACTELERAQDLLRERTVEHEALGERLRVVEAALEEARATETALRLELQQASEAHATRAADAASEHAGAVDGLTARVAELEAANDALRTHVSELETANEALRARASELEAGQRDASSGMEAASSDANARTTAVQAELAATAAERDALRTRLSDLEAAHRTTFADTNEAETRTAAALAELESRSAGALAEAEARTTAAVAAAADWQRRGEAAEAELAAARVSSAGQDEQRDALARDRERLERLLAEAREREAALEARVTALQDEVVRAREDSATLQHGFSRLETLIQSGVERGDLPAADGAAAFDLQDASAFEVVELDGTDGGTDDAPTGPMEVAAFDVEEVVAPDGEADAPAVEAAPPETAAPTAAPHGLAVLDADASWTSVAPPQAAVAVVAPTEGAIAAVQDGNPERLLLNLAAPDALGTLAALRSAGVAVPCVACIVPPGQNRGLLLGRFDVAPRPIDPDALLANLRGVFARGTRVVTAGADVDGLISLRQALARLGVSVSMAWDAKQAGDLLAMVRPDVAILDLELPPKDGCHIVARIGLASPAPLTVVVPKPADTAAAFASALAHPELGRATVGVRELLKRVLDLPLGAQKKPEPAGSPARR